MDLRKWMKKYARDYNVTLAQEALREMRRLCSVPGNPRIKATPGAPPRKITGRLLRGLKIRRTPKGASLISEAPYSSFLENMGHHFFWLAIENVLKRKKHK